MSLFVEHVRNGILQLFKINMNSSPPNGVLVAGTYPIRGSPM